MMTFFFSSKIAVAHIRLTDLLAIITPNCQDSIPDSSNPAQKLWMRLRRIGYQRTTGLSHPLHTLVMLSHMSDRKAFGSLIVTMWKSAYFQSLLCGNGAH